MPLQSISCANCGSGDIQEVKPDTYFCNHCDSVFKYVAPSRLSGARSCEVLADRRECGIPAVGLCATDGRAFCKTHQARNGPTAFVNQCKPCYSAELKLARAESEAYEKRFGKLYLEGFARQEMKAAGVPTIQLIWTYTERVRKSFGRENLEERIVLMGTGWLLGEFEWEYNDGGNYGGTYVRRQQLTVLIDTWQGAHINARPNAMVFPPKRSDVGLCRVREPWQNYLVQHGYHPQHGYYLVEHGSLDNHMYPRVSAAIHNLAGT